jgi:hypothetical protein
MEIHILWKDMFAFSKHAGWLQRLVWVLVYPRIIIEIDGLANGSRERGTMGGSVVDRLGGCAE